MTASERMMLHYKYPDTLSFSLNLASGTQKVLCVRENNSDCRFEQHFTWHVLVLVRAEVGRTQEVRRNIKKAKKGVEKIQAENQ